MWLQVFHKNGTIEINTRENGLGRLDDIVKAAKAHNLHVVFSLTNNWFRGASSDKTSNKHRNEHKYDDEHGDKDKYDKDKYDKDKYGDKHGDKDKYDKDKYGDKDRHHGKDRHGKDKHGYKKDTSLDRRFPRNFLSNDYG